MISRVLVGVLVALFAITVALPVAAETSAAKPRFPLGVKPDKTSVFVSGGPIRCDGNSVEVPLSSVNDDFCDCADGTDEPGTSACPNGQFWCVNRHHVGYYIPSSRVGDGVCDCCDASDEVDGVCENTCRKLGEEKLRAAHKERMGRLSGDKTRQEWALQGKTKKGEREAELVTVRAELAEKQTAQTTAEEAKREAEEIEQRAKKEHEDAWNAGKAARDEAREAARDAEAAARAQEQEGVDDQDAPVDDENVWTKVRNVFSGWFSGNEEDNGKGDTDDEPMPEYPPETQTLIKAADEARNALTNANSDVTKLQNTINDLEAKLRVDYGPNEEFQPMEGECVEYVTSEYKYRLCPFDQVTQESKKGGSRTTLGKWGSWKEDGEGAERYGEMQFRHGQKCWGGPDRSIVVKVQCGESQQLSTVAEPNKCEYTAVLSSPAACWATDADYAFQRQQQQQQQTGHEEPRDDEL